MSSLRNPIIQMAKRGRSFLNSNSEASYLSHVCDMYVDPRLRQDGGVCTSFNVDKDPIVRDKAKVALDVYNQIEQKNFTLEKVCQLNILASAYFCMIFWARNAESDERHLFRAGVYLIGGDDVKLCEIKDGDEPTIPAEHEENFNNLSDSLEDLFSYSCSDNDQEDDSVVGFADDDCISSDGSDSEGENQGPTARSHVAEGSVK